MSKEELYKFIKSLSDDLEFDYLGIHGSVCPFSHSDIVLSYGEDEIRLESAEETMNYKLFHGKSLNEIADQLSVY